MPFIAYRGALWDSDVVYLNKHKALKHCTLYKELVDKNTCTYGNEPFVSIDSNYYPGVEEYWK